jgi:glycosyltransferase involved in cell wall biosynthesis
MTNSTPRVLVDLSHLYPDGLSGGIKPALLEMLRWLASRQDPEIHFVYVVRASTREDVAAIARPVDRLVPADRVPRDLAARELCDVAYCPFGSTTLSCPGIPTVTLIVDLLHRDFPASITSEEQALRETWFTEAMGRTDLFQVISEYTAQQLGEHYGVKSGSIFKTYLPLQQRFARSPALPSATIRREFFFYPANAWAHKNHANLLLAYADYFQSEGPAAWRLVLTGADDARMDKVRALAVDLQITPHVDFLGYVSEHRLAELWAQAGALVFPSLHEGFGIPLLEAMAHGVPIVASRATAIPEVVGPAALLVDARQPGEMAAAMRRMATEPELRRGLIAHGYRQLDRFSPDQEFSKLQQALHEAARHPARWRRTGYYEVDGLTDPEAVFALPPGQGPGTVHVVLRPLPANRLLQIWCGPDLIDTVNVPAGQTADATFTFVPRVRVLSLRVPNASRLSETDPRVHGVLLQSLSWNNGKSLASLLAS